MRRFLAPLLLAISLLSGSGCARVPPSLAAAGRVAREVSCAVCAATGEADVRERAALLADGLRAIAEEMAAVAERGGAPAEVRAVLAELAKNQEEDRALFEELLKRAAASGAK